MHTCHIIMDTQAAGGDGLLAISSDQPSIFRKDTKDCFQWRVRNIEYPLEVFFFFFS